MPHLTVELSWQKWETLETVSRAEQIPPEEVVRRALDAYLAEEIVQLEQPEDDTVAATRDHLVQPDEVMNLDL
jgi:hypothetical protein